MSYVSKKIAHLKRAGLVSASQTGYGQHGGACPDWLVKEQKERREKASKASFNRATRLLTEPSAYSLAAE